MDDGRPGEMVSRAPGRVNLIGEHTDYTGGLVMPMAIDRWTEITFRPDPRVVLTSADESQPADIDTSVDDVAGVEPGWARYVAGVVAEARPNHGIRGHVTTSIPIGAGLSSSAALEVAVALALGCEGDPVEIAELCRRAEHRASGVPTGIMDQLAITAGRADHALLIDCHNLTVTPTRLPDGIDVVVRFIAHRRLIGSPYAERVAQCAEAEALIGPLRSATVADTERIDDPRTRARARHITSENQRVRDFAAALAARDLAAVGRLMVESHESLRTDFEISTPAMDAAVQESLATPGVYGSRMTGGGFGGCIVSICEPGALRDGWVVNAVDGAAVVPVTERTDTED
jgi:galactokinase